MKGGIVVVEGNIGAGKSTFSKILAEKLEGVFISEPDEKNNPYLSDYYKDPARWAFDVQIFLLSSRYRAHKYAQSLIRHRGGGFVVMDRSYYGDVCFANVQKTFGYFSERDYKTYMAHHADMKCGLEPPIASIFLDVTPENCKKRISKRMSEKEGRRCEASIDLGYLEALKTEINTLKERMNRNTNVFCLEYNADLSREQIEEKAEEMAESIKGLEGSVYDYWLGTLGTGE